MVQHLLVFGDCEAHSTSHVCRHAKLHIQCQNNFWMKGPRTLQLFGGLLSKQQLIWERLCTSRKKGSPLMPEAETFKGPPSFKHGSSYQAFNDPHPVFFVTGKLGSGVCGKWAECQGLLGSVQRSGHPYCLDGWRSCEDYEQWILSSFLNSCNQAWLRNRTKQLELVFFHSGQWPGTLKSIRAALSEVKVKFKANAKLWPFGGH